MSALRDQLGQIVQMAATLAFCCPVHAEPVITGDTSRPECPIALQMASDAFLSTSPSLVLPVVQPNPSEASVVLARNAADISGGNGLDHDPEIFERIEIAHGKEVYWQKEAVAGQRLVVMAAPFNWQGDWYYTFRLDAALTLDDFFRAEALEKKSEEAPVGAGVVPPVQLVLGDNRWAPPVVVRAAKSGALWLVDPGEPYEILAAWRVFVMGPGGMVSPCQANFRDDGPVGLQRLPKLVRQFAALADEALGPGSGEGTLQTTARTRLEVERRWALATERPWALTGRVKSSRSIVDTGLEAWAYRVPAREKLLGEMRGLEAGAERALASYYRKAYGLSAAEADRFAAYGLDFMFRSYFRFPDAGTGKEASVDPPWPMRVRQRVAP